MADVECTISGLDDLDKKLSELLPKQAKTAIRRAGRASGEILEVAIEAAAPRLTGMLADSFIIRSNAAASESPGVSTITVHVKVDSHAFRYAEGTHELISGPTFTTKGNKQKLVMFGKSGPLKYPYHWAHLEARFYEFGSIHQPARPFIAPAFEENRDRILNIFIDELNEQLGKFS
ncbi:MAG: HK97-gp10 family putative phage morphogenesis protein [Terriglobales bacterium]